EALRQASASALALEEARRSASAYYEGGLRQVAELAPVLDRFFDDVLVMAEDPEVRRNRIALLQAIGQTVSRTAKLTEVVVDKAEARAKAG
ncbi:MAG: glycine--tRNA ligase subunit beta, partial [Acidobacteria bacterium]